MTQEKSKIYHQHENVEDINNNEKHPQNKKKNKKRNKLVYKLIKRLFLLIITIFLIIASIIAIYISTLNIPDFSNFANRKIDNSTQIYDRTGNILLYDVNSDVKRVQISSDRISPIIKNATVAIEDKYFYSHKGVRPTSIIRAMFANIQSGSFVQGGSTIDQQLIKNAILTRNKSIIRKIKEWAMAIKLDSQVSKDDILTMYLNESCYGGNICGVETASEYFFGIHAKDVSLSQAAYLAALPNAPSYYSPYGDHIDELENRKNLILKEMYDQNMITGDEYQKALVEKVVWQKNITEGKALHFVFFVKDYLEKKYGKDVVDTGGLKVITTLDYNLQSQGESIVNKHALDNTKKYQATNAGLIAIDPKTGQILTMVGSRNYFDTEIPGNFNVTTALRQPGSSFKPIVYATAFMQGYIPDTVLFDVPTEFSTTCSPIISETKDTTGCYTPQNYDGKFRGPISMRNALAQSLNIPAVKTLYLAGVKNSIDTAQKMGITSLDENGDYGLSLVLGSGEVSLLQMTNSYGVFANEGVYNPPAFILSVTDKDGNVLEKYKQNNLQVIPSYVSDEINDILSDNVARTPLYGPSSGLYFGDRPVAAKTGTTNSYRDTWTIGYTPSISVGVWAGNNDNTPINKGMSGMVAVPMWNEFMTYALKNQPIDKFIKPDINQAIPNTSNTTPPVKGVYCYIDKNNNPVSYSILNQSDSQYNLWKIPADIWVSNNGCYGNKNENNINTIPTTTNETNNNIPTTTSSN